MRPVLFKINISVASLLWLSIATLVFAQEGRGRDSENVKVEAQGKLRAYRMELFGETAATVTAGSTDFWLDYSKNNEIKKKGIVSFDEKKVVVKGTLEFRDFRARFEPTRKEGGNGGPSPLLRGQPVIVVESLEEVK